MFAIDPALCRLCDHAARWRTSGGCTNGATPTCSNISTAASAYGQTDCPNGYLLTHVDPDRAGCYANLVSDVNPASVSDRHTPGAYRNLDGHRDPNGVPNTDIYPHVWADQYLNPTPADGDKYSRSANGYSHTRSANADLYPGAPDSHLHPGTADTNGHPDALIPATPNPLPTRWVEHLILQGLGKGQMLPCFHGRGVGVGFHLDPSFWWPYEIKKG